MTYSLLKNSVNNTATAAFNPSTSAQDLYTFGIGEKSQGDYLLINAMVSIEQTGTSVAQTLTLQIKDGATVVKSFTFKTYAVLKYDILQISVPIRKETRGNITLTLAAAGGADAQTAIIVTNTWLAGID